MKSFTGQKTKEVIDRAWALPHYCQLPDKFLSHFEGYMTFPWYFKIFCICPTLSRGTPHDALRNPGWETVVWLLLNYVQSARMSLHQAYLHNGVLYC